MVDYKKIAMILGMMILLPLFLGLFFDAVYPAPKYDDFCKASRDMTYAKPAPEACNAISSQLLECTAKAGAVSGTQIFDCKVKSMGEKKCVDVYNSPESLACSEARGNPIYQTNDDCCQVYEKCDYCNRDFTDAQSMHNRNLFFILAPIGLLIIILGLYVASEYLGAGFMFGGLITLFYATVVYFTEMSKLARAFVILVELLIIIWIGYKKIGKGEDGGFFTAKAKAKSSGRKR